MHIEVTAAGTALEERHGGSHDVPDVGRRPHHVTGPRQADNALLEKLPGAPQVLQEPRWPQDRVPHTGVGDGVFQAGLVVENAGSCVAAVRSDGGVHHEMFHSLLCGGVDHVERHSGLQRQGVATSLWGSEVTRAAPSSAVSAWSASVRSAANGSTPSA